MMNLQMLVAIARGNEKSFCKLSRRHTTHAMDIKWTTARIERWKCILIFYWHFIDDVINAMILYRCLVSDTISYCNLHALHWMPVSGLWSICGIKNWEAMMERSDAKMKNEEAKADRIPKFGRVADINAINFSVCRAFYASKCVQRANYSPFARLSMNFKLW